jgi:hypothetical protein
MEGKGLVLFPSFFVPTERKAELGDEAWWHQPLRLLRYDWVYDIARARDADLHALAHLIRDRFHCNVDGAQATPGIPPAADPEAGMGTVTFHAPGYRPYPGLEEWDWLRHWIPVAHEHGLRMVPYLNLHWFNYRFGQEHPEWLQRLADGRPYGEVYPLYGNGTTMCVNSHWRDWAFGLVEAVAHTGADGAFLDGPVVFPDCCYCESCRALFRERCGADLPLEMDWDSPLWKEFVAFREDSLAGFVREARAAFRKHTPEGILFCNAGTFRPGAWRVARDIERLQDSQDICLAEAFFHPGRADIPLHFAALTGKYERAGQLPGMVGMHHLYGPYHYVSLNAEEMGLALAQAAAVGAGVYVVTAHDAITTMAEETLAGMEPLALQERYEDLWVGAESGAEIAVLASSATLHFYVSCLEGIYQEGGPAIEEGLVADLSTRKHVDWAARKQVSDQLVTLAFDGWFDVLTRHHFQFDVLLDSRVTTDELSRYRLLILPNVACLHDAQIDAIEAYLQQGGALIASFESGAYDERGRRRERWRIGELCGIQRLVGAFTVSKSEEFTVLAAEDEIARGLGKGHLVPRAHYAALVESELPPAAVYYETTGGLYRPLRQPSSRPSIVAQRSPRTVYLAEELGHAYSTLKTPWHEDLLCNAVQFCLDSNPAVTTDGPSTLEIELWRKPGKLLLHLVNNTGDMRRPIGQRIPLSAFMIRVQCPAEPGKIWTARKGPGREPALAHTWRDGQLEITLPGLDLYDIVVAEW